MNQIPNLATSHGWTECAGGQIVEPSGRSTSSPKFELIIRHEVASSGFQNFIEKCPGFVPFVRQTDRLNQPDVMLTRTPRIPGLDGRKMSKSYGNTITLSESDADIRAKTK